MQAALTVHCARLYDLLPQVRRPFARWLTKGERLELGRWHDTARRSAWLAGRALVKQIAAKRVAEDSGCPSDLDPLDIEVLSQTAENKGCRPQIRICQTAMPWTLSLAHSEEVVVAAIATDLHHLGIDAAPFHAAGRRNLRTWLIGEEQAWIECDPGATALVWAAKEAVYKAANRGEPLLPREIEIARLESGQLVGKYHFRGAAQPFVLQHWPFAGHSVVLAQAVDTGRRLELDDLQCLSEPSSEVPLLC